MVSPGGRPGGATLQGEGTLDHPAVHLADRLSEMELFSATRASVTVG